MADPVCRLGNPNEYCVPDIQLASKIQATYPSTAFATGAKPIVRGRAYQGDLANFDGFITANLSTASAANLSLEIAICYLNAVASATTARGTGAWTSFGVQISADDHSYSVASIYTFQATGDVFEVTGAAAGGDRLYNLFMLFAPVRLHSALRPEHRPILATRYANVMADRLKGLTPTAWAQKCAGWDQNPSYAALAAAYDMFLFRAESHEFSKVRIGTTPLRFKDCTMIGVLEVFRQAVHAKDLVEASYWIWNSQVGEEFQSIFKLGEELDEKHSYAPYYSGFKLGTRSPYSATMSPQLHYFIHTIGCLSNSKRSIHARVITDVGIEDARDNGLVVGYIMGGRRRHVAQFYRPSEAALFRAPTTRPRVECIPAPLPAERGEHADIEDDRQSVSSVTSAGSFVPRILDEDPDILEPLNKEPSAWYQYMLANNFSMTRRMEISVLNILAALDKTRPDTIGDHLKSYARSKLRTLQQV